MWFEKKVVISVVVNIEKLHIVLKLISGANDEKLISLLRYETLQCNKIQIIPLYWIHLDHRLEVRAWLWLFVVRNVVNLFFFENWLRFINITAYFICFIALWDWEPVARGFETGNGDLFVEEDLGIEHVVVDFSWDE